MLLLLLGLRRSHVLLIVLDIRRVATVGRIGVCTGVLGIVLGVLRRVVGGRWGAVSTWGRGC